MPELEVVGSGPIAYTTESGSFLLIPLSDLYFDKEEVKVKGTSPSAQYEGELKPWLAYLAETGALKRGAAPPPRPAMVIEAKDAGAAGNNIEVTFKNIQVVDPSDASQTTFDATITETDTYTELSLDDTSPRFIQKLLGTSATKGTQPGLVLIKGINVPTSPAAAPLPKAAKQYKLARNGEAASFVSIEGDLTGTNFTLAAKEDGPEGDNTTVIISDINDVKKTFTLVAIWTKSIAGIKVTDLPHKLQGTTSEDPNPYEIKVSLPKGSSSYVVPSPGTVRLSGGADAKAEANASGTAYAS